MPRKNKRKIVLSRRSSDAQRKRRQRQDDANRTQEQARNTEAHRKARNRTRDAATNLRSNEPNEKKPVVTILVLIHPQGEKTQELSPKHRKTWIARINHQNPLTCYSKVCPDHFIAGKKRKHNVVVKFQNLITMEHSYATDVSNMSCNEAVEMQGVETACGETKVHAEQCGTGALKCPVHTCMSDTSHATYQTSKSLSQNTFSKEKQRLVVASECKQIFVQVSTDGSETTRHSTTKTLLPGASPINGKFMTINELMDVLLSSQSTQTGIPRGLKEDVYFVTDDTSNFDRRLAGKRSCFDDDCGVWRSSGTCMKKYYYRVEGNRMEYLELKNGLFHKPVNQKLIPVQPQPSQDSILILQRYYQVLKIKPEYKKRCTWIEKLPLTSSRYPQQPKLAVVEYVGKFPKDGSPHGNSKKSGNEYIWTQPKTIDEVKNKLAKGEPSRTVYPNFVWNDPNNVPRDMKLVRNNVTWGDQPMQHRKNTEDGVISLLNSIRNEEIAQIFRAKRSPPSVMLYPSELFVDIKNPCINKTMELTRDHSCRDVSRIIPTLAWLGSQNLTAEALRAVIKWLGIEIFGALCARAEPAPMRVKLCSLATQKFTLTMYIELCLFMELCCARQGLKQPSVSQRGNYAEMEGSAGIRINVDGKYSITPKEDGRDLENGRGGEAQQELHLHHMLSHILY